jgi:FMN phosphatase YigB (HAD superfamily)
LKHLWLRIVVVSNSTYRDAEMYRRDFAARGWWELIDAVVTSVDVGYAKPSEVICRAALTLSQSALRECVMIGDTEELDIVPARSLGMRTILVAIERPAPAHIDADACVESLTEVVAALRSMHLG